MGNAAPLKAISGYEKNVWMVAYAISYFHARTKAVFVKIFKICFCNQSTVYQRHQF